MRARILIIDDDRDSLTFMKYLLGSYGHAVVPATDGIEGLQSAQNTRPDLIISDFQVPRLNGCELARQLKQDESLRRVPLVAVTASAMPADRDRILAAGFDLYISKPIVPETFVNQIEEMLPVEMRSGAKRDQSDQSKLNRRAQFVREMAEAFAQNVPTMIASLQTAYSDGDFKQLRKTAHRAVGSCIFLKEPDLIAAFRRLERTIDDNDDRSVIEQQLQDVVREATIVSRHVEESMAHGEQAA